MRHLALLSLLMLTTCGGGGPRGPIYFTVEAPGYPITGLRAMNELGQMVGYVQASPSPADAHALLFDGSSYVIVDPPLASYDTRAFGITEGGDLVGSHDGSHSWQQVGGSATEVTYPSAVETTIRGCNDALDLAGEFLDDSGYDGAFLRIAGSFVEITIPGATRVSARGIDNLGRSVGYYDDAAGVRHGWLRDASGAITPIDAPSAAGTLCGGLNDHGAIVGVRVTADGRWHGFLLVGGTFHDVDVPGAFDTLAMCVNNAGLVGGEYSTEGPYLDYTYPHKGWFSADFTHLAGPPATP